MWKAAMLLADGKPLMTFLPAGGIVRVWYYLLQNMQSAHVKGTI
jgi:hypothetical protein